MTHSEYPVIRRIFLQWMFTERLVLLSEAEAFFQEMIKDLDFGADQDNEKDINVFFDFCKKALNPINFGLKKQIYVQSESKLEYLGIYNMQSDNISQNATNLSAINIANFKKIVDASRESSNHGLRFGDIERIIKGSKTQIQDLLDELVGNKWMEYNNFQGIYFIGPRTLLELSDYLKELGEESSDSNEINSFKECNLCSSIICWENELRCKASECNAVYHKFCIKDYCQTIKKNECPKCQLSLSDII